MRLSAPARNRNPLPPPRWENYTRRSLFVARFFLTFPEKTAKNHRPFFDNSRKYLQFVYITY